MKNLIFNSIFIGIFLIGCSTKVELNEYREIAWESLSDREKETVIHPVSEALVSMNAIFVDRLSEIEPHPEYPAVAVRFNTELDALLGPICVYIDKDSMEIIGQGARF